MMSSYLIVVPHDNSLFTELHFLMYEEQQHILKQLCLNWPYSWNKSFQEQHCITVRTAQKLRMRYSSVFRELNIFKQKLLKLMYLSLLLSQSSSKREEDDW